jgi:DNA-binding GntR family transcriptional regulator
MLNVRRVELVKDNFRVDYEDLSQQVYRMIKQMILVGELKTGEKLLQDELASRLGVSRTPLLSAFSKLEKEMLVEIVPRRGAFVRQYEMHELVDIYEIRVRLEPLGAAEAATNGSHEEKRKLIKLCRDFNKLAAAKDPKMKEIDYEFHMHIMKMSGNRLLYNIISSYSIIPLANFYGFFKNPETSASEHLSVFKAIADGDAKRSRREMFQHINSSRLQLIENVSKQSSQ